MRIKCIKYFVLIACLYIHCIVKSQGTFSCTGVLPSPSGIQVQSGTASPYQYNPANKYNPNTTMQYVRVNFNYMLHSNGTGNFTPTSDGYTSNTTIVYNGKTYPANGYGYAQLQIDQANSMLSSNQQMFLPSGNTTPVYPIQYRLVLAGVYFTSDDNYYVLGTYPESESAYLHNPNNECNVFLVANTDGNISTTTYGSSGGYAYMSGNRAIDIEGEWQYYCCNYNVNNISQSFWAFARLLNHEIGHNLGLAHTVKELGGACCTFADDASTYGCSGWYTNLCPDAPTVTTLVDNYGMNQAALCACEWNNGSTSCDNNLMNYSPGNALTPDQLSIIFYNFTQGTSYEPGVNGYLTCTFPSGVLNLSSTSFTPNQLLYYSSTINLPASGSTNGSIPSTCSNVTLTGNTVTLNPGFSVPLGTTFNVNPPPCN